jgi:hypothetical protein
MSRARTQADPEAIDRTLDKASIEHYERLAAEADQHLDKLAAQAPLKDVTLETSCAAGASPAASS